MKIQHHTWRYILAVVADGLVELIQQVRLEKFFATFLTYDLIVVQQSTFTTDTSCLISRYITCILNIMDSKRSDIIQSKEVFQQLQPGS